MYEDFTMLTLKRFSGDTLQMLAVYLLLTLLSIAIPAKYKVTESSYNIKLATKCLPMRLYCYLSCQ